MSQISLGQLAKLTARAALPEDAPGHISREVLQALLEGRLVPKTTLVNYAELRTQFGYVWGGYDRVTAIERIEACAQAPAEGDTRLEAFATIHLGYDISTRNALVEIDKQGMRPATLEELLFCYKRYPMISMEFPMAAPGTVLVTSGGDRHAPFLKWDGGKHGLYALDFGFDWRSHFRFLVVQK